MARPRQRRVLVARENIGGVDGPQCSSWSGPCRRAKASPTTSPTADDLTATFPELCGMDLGARTLFLHFFFARDVLLIFPWLIGNGVESVLLPDDGTAFGVNDCGTGFTSLAEEHTSTVDRIVSGILARDSSAAANLSADLRSIYARMFGMLEGPALLEWLRAAIGDLQQCHLVLLADGPLYEFPLHALPIETEASAGSQRLSELLASISYATSARTLALQHDARSVPNHERVMGGRRRDGRGVRASLCTRTARAVLRTCRTRALCLRAGSGGRHRRDSDNRGWSF